jgi:HEXXH motif-containing protein
MRVRLAGSLRYIFAESNGQLDLPAEEWSGFLVELERAPVSPLAFSFYSDAVLAIEDNNLEDASRLLRELIGLPRECRDLIISDLADPSRDAIAERYARFIDTDESFKFEIFPPSPEAAAHCREQIRGAFGWMDATDPELAGEIRALLRKVVLAAGTKQPKAMTFDGASAFMLWGAIIINVNRSDGWLGMVQMLAHESAHNLLFGLSADESLVENSPEELFASPLRRDARPMDGIYHATFVTARMHRAVKRLSESGILCAELQEKARQELAENARLFAQGIETVDRNAKLTSLGRAVRDGARNYFDCCQT